MNCIGFGGSDALDEGIGPWEFEVGDCYYTLYDDEQLSDKIVKKINIIAFYQGRSLAGDGSHPSCLWAT